MDPNKKKLDKDELSRYSRSIMLPEIGTEGQLRLCGGKVLVVGCGALGSIVAMYLAGSGVGHISISDYDTVGLSNLQRQLSFTEHDVGALKTEATERRLRDINSSIEVRTLPEMITRSKAREFFPEYDVIVECSDNPSTKYMVTDVAAETGVPVVLGGVSGWTGQVLTLHRGGIRYRDIFPDEPAGCGVLPCATGGVLGPLPGVVGSVQACEVIKLLAGSGQTLGGRMLLIDMKNCEFREVYL